ncbi:hypothetical protein EV421DRAFT_1914489 [Armillaria borealis]|uniref:Uncharacterized protein n=1 Tax=Armillaria borealis TaxID=47425 RepID=A0AA39MCB4_9AGAR|nr:hypothetical protein EV421DRAFT_1914489 [Armillaria borealis]
MRICIAPPPNCLTTAENPAKIHSMFKFWLHLHVPIIVHLSLPFYLPQLMYQNSWKTLVSLDYLEMTNQWESGETKAAQCRDKMQEFLKGCCDEIEMDFGAGNSESVSWRGKVYSELTPTNHQEIVWEISELGFHLELRELDCLVCAVTPICDVACEMAVLHCFVGPILVANIGGANMGLANPNWFDHVPYLCSLHQVMQIWAGPKPDIVAKDKSSWLWTEAKILELEKEMARYYVDTFFLHFRQPPVLSRYLLHNLSTSFLPFPRVHGQTSVPNVHADISKWE